MTRLFCALGIHAYRASRGHGLAGYWLTCDRHCGLWAWHADRRAA